MVIYVGLRNVLYSASYELPVNSFSQDHSVTHVIASCNVVLAIGLPGFCKTSILTSRDTTASNR